MFTYQKKKKKKKQRRDCWFNVVKKVLSLALGFQPATATRCFGVFSWGGGGGGVLLSMVVRQ